MDFRGHLRLPEDAGTGIPVLLRLDDIFVVISSGDDELGAWRADDVAIERIFSNQFSIELDGESMVFLAQDALGFAYDGITAIEDLQERLTKRRVFKRSKKKPKPVETAPESAPATGASPPSGSAGPASVGDVDVPAASSREGTGPEPADEPILLGEPQAIWTPPAVASPPAPPPVGAEPDIEVAVPEPVLRRIDTEPPAPAPADIRVAYPQPSAPPPPAVESFRPPRGSEEDPVAPGLAAPTSSVAPAPEPEWPSEPDATPGATEIAQEPADPAPVPAEEPAAAAPAPEPEYEIEEVSAASTGGTWADDAATVEVDSDGSEIEIEIEEYVVPSAGAVDMFTAPVPQDEAEPAPPESAEQPPAPEPEGAEPEAIPAPLEEIAPDDPRAPVEGRHVADDTEISEPQELVGDSAADVPVEESVASNGHSKPAKADITQESNKRERRHSLFGRSRDKKVPPHEHEYGEPKTIGGLKRQVCEVCGHVTFSGEDVYQGW